MGKTYMTRLWYNITSLLILVVTTLTKLFRCIWELFMLFTFCNKELGLERMQIICIDDNIDIVSEIENFDIDKAHAFDPNEEYRLRHIMMEVVQGDAKESKVKQSFTHMVNLLHQGKVSTIELKPRTIKKFF